MRGPACKTSLDVRRNWRCPACGYERRAAGHQTAIRCRCTDGPFMKLVSEPRVRPSRNRPVDVYVDAAALLESLGEPPPGDPQPPRADPESPQPDVAWNGTPDAGLLPSESRPASAMPSTEASPGDDDALRPPENVAWDDTADTTTSPAATPDAGETLPPATAPPVAAEPSNRPAGDPRTAPPRRERRKPRRRRGPDRQTG